MCKGCELSKHSIYIKFSLNLFVRFCPLAVIFTKITQLNLSFHGEGNRWLKGSIYLPSHERLSSLDWMFHLFQVNYALTYASYLMYGELLFFFRTGFVNERKMLCIYLHMSIFFSPLPAEGKRACFFNHVSFFLRMQECS